MKRSSLTVGTTAVAVAATLALGACGSSGAGATPTGADGKVTVVTSFYPLQLAAQRIGGGLIDVSVLTKPGTEPHDLELTPQNLASLSDASVVVYSKGFQPAVDEAIESAEPASALDVSGAARLTLTATEDGHEHEGEGEGTEQAEEHADETEGKDPHFWLDPTRYADVAKAIGARLAEVDPAHAGTYTANTTAFVAELTKLDGELEAGLGSCRIGELVTSHAAFGYLADRYGFEQHGIAGVSPEAEPSAAALAEVTDLVKDHGVTTIYQETLVPPDFARTVAGSTGAKVATLDPVEGITGESAGKDYFEVMRSNLAALRQGQACS